MLLNMPAREIDSSSWRPSRCKRCDDLCDRVQRRFECPSIKAPVQNRNPLFTLRRRQASLTIEPLHQSFAVSVSALFSGSGRKSPQQIDQRRGVRCITKTKSRAFLAACGCASGTTGTTESARKGFLRSRSAVRRIWQLSNSTDGLD